MRKIQRRDFLKAMGLATAALGLTACGGSLPEFPVAETEPAAAPVPPALPAFPVHRLPAAVPRPLRHSRKQQGRRLPPRGPLWPSSKPGN